MYATIHSSILHRTNFKDAILENFVGKKIPSLIERPDLHVTYTLNLVSLLKENQTNISEIEKQCLKVGIIHLYLRIWRDFHIRAAHEIDLSSRFWSDRLHRPLLHLVEEIPNRVWHMLTSTNESLNRKTIISRIKDLEQILHKELSMAGKIQLLINQKSFISSESEADRWIVTAIESIRQTPLSLLSRPLRNVDARVGLDLDELLQITQDSLSNDMTLHWNDFSTTLDCQQLSIPSIQSRYWLYGCLTIPFVASSAYWMSCNYDLMSAWANSIMPKLTDFVQEHIVIPVQSIINELFFAKKHIADDKAHLDSEASLKKQISDFIKDFEPNMSEQDKKKAIDSMDMSVISRHYEKSLPNAMKNVLTGDIVRMLLIQVQFLKKELLVAMQSIEELIQSNEINLRILSTIPAVIVCFGLYKLFQFGYMIASDEKSTREVFKKLRSIIVTIERLLNLRNCSPDVGSIGSMLQAHQADFIRSSVSSIPKSPNKLPSSVPVSISIQPSFLFSILTPFVSGIYNGFGWFCRIILKRIDSLVSKKKKEMIEKEEEELIEDDSVVILPLDNEQEQENELIPVDSNPSHVIGESLDVSMINNPVASSSPVLLSRRDTGLLLLLLYEFREAIWKVPSRFKTEELADLREDLAELAGERGILTISQQMAVVLRMQRTYHFLSGSNSGLLDNLNL